MEYILIMWQIGCHLFRRSLVSCFRGVHQAKSIWRYHSVGWQSWRHPLLILSLRRFPPDWYKKNWHEANGTMTSKILAYGSMQVSLVCEDAYWLRPEQDSKHINLAEFDDIIKGISSTIIWKTIILHLFRNSVCTHKLIYDPLTSRDKVRTKAISSIKYF